jgi:hypothetical protein
MFVRIYSADAALSMVNLFVTHAVLFLLVDKTIDDISLFVVGSAFIV